MQKETFEHRNNILIFRHLRLKNTLDRQNACRLVCNPATVLGNDFSGLGTKRVGGVE